MMKEIMDKNVTISISGESCKGTSVYAPLIKLIMEIFQKEFPNASFAERIAYLKSRGIPISIEDAEGLIINETIEDIDKIFN
jgi:hypothetical protein